MIKFRITIYLLLAFLSVSCTAISSPTPMTLSPSETIAMIPPSTLPPPTATVQLFANTPAPSPTTTLLPPIATSTLAPVAMVDPSTRLGYQCIEQVAALPESARLEGTLVLRDKVDSVFLLNLETGVQIPFNQDDQSIGAFQISPDHKWIYYTDSKGPWSEKQYGAFLATLDGVVSTLPYKNEWRGVRWLDDERLIILHDREPYNLAIVFNPFSGEEREITLNLPNPYYFHTLYNTQILLNAMDPSLLRVVYFDTEGIGRLIFWDVSAGKMLAWLPHPVPDDPSALPPSSDLFDGWSPDGSQFIAVSPVTFLDTASDTIAAEELFSISLGGQVKQLTHLSAKYGYVRISQPLWSSDGRYIAFWLQTDENPDHLPRDLVQRLAILDTVTENVIDYCIVHGSPKYSTGIWPAIWSPDSRQLIVRIHSDDGNWPIILVDIEEGYAVKITANLIPVGWMVAP